MYVDPELVRRVSQAGEPTVEMKFRAEWAATRPERRPRVRQIMHLGALEAKLLVAANMVKAGRFLRFA